MGCVRSCVRGRWGIAQSESYHSYGGARKCTFWTPFQVQSLHHAGVPLELLWNRAGTLGQIGKRPYYGGAGRKDVDFSDSVTAVSWPGRENVQPPLGVSIWHWLDEMRIPRNSGANRARSTTDGWPRPGHPDLHVERPSHSPGRRRNRSSPNTRSRRWERA